MTTEWLEHFGYEAVEQASNIYGNRVAANPESNVYVFDVAIGQHEDDARCDGLHMNRFAHACDTVVVDLPKRFYADHLQRDLSGGLIERETSKGYRVRLDREAYEDLVGDADYYAGFTGDDRRDNLGLCTSAAATLKRLRAIDVPSWGDARAAAEKAGIEIPADVEIRRTSATPDLPEGREVASRYQVEAPARAEVARLGRFAERNPRVVFVDDRNADGGFFYPWAVEVDRRDQT